MNNKKEKWEMIYDLGSTEKEVSFKFIPGNLKKVLLKPSKIFNSIHKKVSFKKGSCNLKVEVAGMSS